MDCACAVLCTWLWCHAFAAVISIEFCIVDLLACVFDFGVWFVSAVIWIDIVLCMSLYVANVLI
jgi:hypothetical protein